MLALAGLTLLGMLEQLRLLYSLEFLDQRLRDDLSERGSSLACLKALLEHGLEILEALVVSFAVLRCVRPMSKNLASHLVADVLHDLVVFVVRLDVEVENLVLILVGRVVRRVLNYASRSASASSRSDALAVLGFALISSA